MNFFPIAYADATSDIATTANSVVHQSGPWSTVIMLVAFFGIFYFLLIRPQQKRAKQHRALIAALAPNDEIITTGGIMGKVAEIDNNAITLEIAPNVNIKIQKLAIGAILPKGSLKF